MNTDFSLSELFDRYLENDLNILERQEFELRIKADLAFAERFRLHKEVDQALIEDDILSFRLKLEKIRTKNSELVQVTPMVISEELKPEIDHAILEQDVMALRDQLNRIHSLVIEEVDPVEIKGYSGIERAILNQDSMALNTELGVFEELVSRDEVIQDNYLSFFNQDVDQAIMQEDVMSLRSRLEDIGERTVGDRKTIPMSRRVITYASTAVAAVFILVFAGSLFLRQTSASLTSERTFSKYFMPYDAMGIKRGGSETGYGAFELGLQKYNKGELKNALEFFELSISESKINDQVLIYAATSAMFTGDPDKALRYLGKLDISSLNYDQVEWYSAGCYLKKNDIEKAKAILKKISADPEHSYYNEATAMLK
ncbi:MAG: tetratricopeptide repeat protein [Bacteroidia bacterium]|nr:tetratricopeptide repeat protein [Bacteroidia bacterium]